MYWSISFTSGDFKMYNFKLLLQMHLFFLTIVHSSSLHFMMCISFLFLFLCVYILFQDADFSLSLILYLREASKTLLILNSRFLCQLYYGICLPPYMRQKKTSINRLNTGIQTLIILQINWIRGIFVV